MNLMGNSNKKLLVHRDIKSIDTNEHIDIILTPQFYTFLQEELGVKFSYQAKQIAPSLFDDYLDGQKEYQYYVHKCNNNWCFFAYNIEEITLFLEEKGINRHQIGKIFFAQELAPYINQAINLGDTLALQSIDGITTIFPKRLLENEYNYKVLNLNDISLHNGISIGSSYSALIPLKQTIILTSILIILGTIFIIEGSLTKNSIKSNQEKLELLLAKNPKLSSKRIRESILEQYAPIDKKERQKRDIIDKISKLLSSNSRLKDLSIDDTKVVGVIDTTNTKVANQVVINAHNKKLITKKESANQIRVEGSL